MWFKGSNMILCYCRCQNPEGGVSPRRAAPSRGRSPSDSPKARQHPREFDTNNTQTQSCLIPITTWCHHFPTATNIMLIKSNLKFESRATAVSTPDLENARATFAGDWACEIELHQTRVICFPWRQRSWSYGVFKSWISYAHCPFQWKLQVLHNYDISVLQQAGLLFNGIACLMKVWPLFKRDFPRVSMTWISNVTSQM